MFCSTRFVIYILFVHLALTADAFGWDTINSIVEKIRNFGFRVTKPFISGKYFNRHAKYNILMIGQTGSGKTSLLNLLLNINRIVDSKDIRAAMKNLRLFNNISLEFKSDKEKMTSKTMGCQGYASKFKSYSLRIVDTPGFGDSRGFEYDKNHTKSIANAIKKLEYVHCIILVINGREAVMNALLKYVLEQVFSIMPDTIQNNIVVVFTNVNDMYDLNFDISSLSEFIPNGIKHYWLIDNPICKLDKLQKLSQNGSLHEHRIIKDHYIDDIEISLKKSTKTILNMYKTISNFKPVNSRPFQELYDLKENIEKNYLNLSSQHKDLINEKKRIQDYYDEIQLYKNKTIQYMDFNKTSTVSKTILQPTEQHNTLCAHSGCFHNCHLNCSLPLTLIQGDRIFKGCAAMDSEGLNCTLCGHSYEYHYHVKSKWVTTIETKNYIDVSLQQSFNLAKSNEERANIAWESAKLQLTQITNDILEKQKKLLDLLEDYKKIGLRKNYDFLLQSQQNYVETSIKTYHGNHNDDVYQNLLEWKSNLQIMLSLQDEKPHSDL